MHFVALLVAMVLVVAFPDMPVVRMEELVPDAWGTDGANDA
jgi:hypothetical protein